MRRLWLVFAQAVTVALATLFVISTLKPDWVSAPVQTPSSVVVIQAPDNGYKQSAAGSYADAASRSIAAR